MTRQGPLLLSLSLLGCGSAPEAPPTPEAPLAPAVKRPDPGSAPAADALDCEPFPFAPEGNEGACAASEVVQGLAVEKRWHLVPGEPRGALTPDHPDRWGVEWSLLAETATGWQRVPLLRLSCEAEMAADCSHDELFRRQWEIARDGDRVALYAAPDRSVPKAEALRYQAFLPEGLPPFVFFVREGADSAAGLLVGAPGDLEAAYRADPGLSNAFAHALAAADAGHPEARRALERVLVTDEDPDRVCSPASRLLSERPDDRWLVEQLDRPACESQVAAPGRTATLALSPACRAALKRCGLTTEASMPVTVYDSGPRTNVLALDGGAVWLGEGFDLFGHIEVDGLLFVADERCPTGALRSQTGVIWTGERAVACTAVAAPVVVVPEVGELRPGVCGIPAGVCGGGVSGG